MTNTKHQHTIPASRATEFSGPSDVRESGMNTCLFDGTGVYMDDRGYYRYDGVIDAKTFVRAGCRVGRNNEPALLHDLYYGGSLDLQRNPGLVADAWSSAEFPTKNLEPRTWEELFDSAGYTHDGQRASRPTEPITLYRGCHHERRFGPSWTCNFNTALWFANRDLGDGRGNVYVHHAQPRELLAYIGPEVGRGEDEYVLNPSHLDDANVAQWSTTTINSARQQEVSA
jgi:hypothetical protein